MRLRNLTAAKTTLAIFLMASFTHPAFGAATETWKSLLSEGDLCETKHEHQKAIQTFDQAANFAERNKLPSKCLELALCRQAAVEVQANKIAHANAHCDKLMGLVAREKASNTLDPDLEVWILNLANAYQANLNPSTREQCLQKFCMINKVLYGENHKDYKNARAALAEYYERTQPLKAARMQESANKDALVYDQTSSDPMVQGYALNQLAMNCRMTGNLEKARDANLQLLKLAKTSPQVADGTITYYASLGTIELARGKEAESKCYFDKARQEGSKIRGNQKKEALATGSLNVLADKVRLDKNTKYPNLLSNELASLLTIQQSISADPRTQYSLMRILGEALYVENKLDDSEKCLKRAIEIAKLPASMVSKDVPELYTQMATHAAIHGQIARSNELFKKALAAETDKKGFGATRTLVYWGGTANNRGDFSLAREKLLFAMKQANDLSAETRGTLLLDAAWGVIPALKHFDQTDHMNEIQKVVVAEQRLQRRLNTGLGPNFFHML